MGREGDGVMSMQQSTIHAREPEVPEPGAITLATWLAEGTSARPKAALQLITRIANALGDAPLHGVRHGTLSTEDVVLRECSRASLGAPFLRGFAPWGGAWPRR